MASTAQLRQKSGGFTFIELIVGLAIVVMIAAVVTPAVTATLDRSRREQATTILAKFMAGIHAFRVDVPRYPGSLSQLTQPITTSDVNSCGSTYSPGHASSWIGPYYTDRVLTAGGAFPVFVGSAQDNLDRITDGSTTLLAINVVGVRFEDALMLDRDIDGSDGLSAGTVRWDATAADGTVTLQYVSTISGC